MTQYYEVYAIKYAERNSRTRADSFIFDPHHDHQHDMDYFIWVIKNDERTILVDTGYDMAEAKRRNRPIQIDPSDALAKIGLSAENIDTCIITHLHYDHAGSLGAFENAHFHLQEAEMAFATGPCMCHDTLKAPFTADHVCDMVKRVYSGKVQFHSGEGFVAPGVTVHLIGGHSRGLQVVRVETETGPLVLASDTAHYYENFMAGKPFPIVVDLEDMLEGFNQIRALAGGDDTRIIPGHDPLVRLGFPKVFAGSGVEVNALHLGANDANFLRDS